MTDTDWSALEQLMAQGPAKPPPTLNLGEASAGQFGEFPEAYTAPTSQADWWRGLPTTPGYSAYPEEPTVPEIPAAAPTQTAWNLWGGRPQWEEVSQQQQAARQRPWDVQAPAAPAPAAPYEPFEANYPGGMPIPTAFGQEEPLGYPAAPGRLTGLPEWAQTSPYTLGTMGPAAAAAPVLPTMGPSPLEAPAAGAAPPPRAPGPTAPAMAPPPPPKQGGFWRAIGGPRVDILRGQAYEAQLRPYLLAQKAQQTAEQEAAVARAMPSLIAGGAPAGPPPVPLSPEAMATFGLRPEEVAEPAVSARPGGLPSSAAIRANAVRLNLNLEHPKIKSLIEGVERQEKAEREAETEYRQRQEHLLKVKQFEEAITPHFFANGEVGYFDQKTRKYVMERPGEKEPVIAQTEQEAIQRGPLFGGPWTQAQVDAAIKGIRAGKAYEASLKAQGEKPPEYDLQDAESIVDTGIDPKTDKPATPERTAWAQKRVGGEVQRGERKVTFTAQEQTKAQLERDLDKPHPNPFRLIPIDPMTGPAKANITNREVRDKGYIEQSEADHNRYQGTLDTKRSVERARFLYNNFGGAAVIGPIIGRTNKMAELASAAPPLFSALQAALALARSAWIRSTSGAQIGPVEKDIDWDIISRMDMSTQEFEARLNEASQQMDYKEQKARRGPGYAILEDALWKAHLKAGVEPNIDRFKAYEAKVTQWMKEKGAKPEQITMARMVEAINRGRGAGPMADFPMPGK
jgi:hypothetical protein